MVQKSQSYLITATDLLAGFTDVDIGDSLSISGLALNASPGLLIDNLDDTWTYESNVGDNGIINLDYFVFDGTVNVATTQHFELTSLNGVSSVVENAVPGLGSGVTGDGNGDGTADSLQLSVASLQTYDDPNNNADTVVWATMDTGGENLSAVSVSETPNNLPIGASMPFGQLNFTVGEINNTATGQTVAMTLYLTGTWMQNGSSWTNENNDMVNGYWKQDTAGQWHDIADSITLQDNKLKINFSLTDGAWMDDDGLANGQIIDPSGAGLFNHLPEAPFIGESTIESSTLTIDVISNHAFDADGDTLIITEISNLKWDVPVFTVNNPVTQETIDLTQLLPFLEISTDAQSLAFQAPAEFEWLATGQNLSFSFDYKVAEVDNPSQISAGHTTIQVLGATGNGLVWSGTNNSDVKNGTEFEDILEGLNNNDALFGLGGTDSLHGNNGDDSLFGGNGIDYLFGDNGDDVLAGGRDGDFLFGGKGNDSLNGDEGNDWLFGDRGNDILTGGVGSDVFSFSKASGNNVITDFVSGIDKINISADTKITNFDQLSITSDVDTVIDLGKGGQVILVGITSNEIVPSDFIFIL